MTVSGCEPASGEASPLGDFELVPGHLLWRVGFVEVTRIPYFGCFGRVGRWTFPGVGRVPGNRAHSQFSNWFTYEWVARVSW